MESLLIGPSEYISLANKILELSKTLMPEKMSVEDMMKLHAAFGACQSALAGVMAENGIEIDSIEVQELQ